MKSRFFAFLKSPIGKFHTSFALFIAFNLLSGLVNLFIHYTPLLVSIHFYSGLLILLSPAVFLLASKNRGMILKAFSRIALFNKADFANLRIAVLLFKATATIILLLTLVNALTGIFYKFGLLLFLEPYTIHVIDFKILLAVIPVHILSAFALHRKEI